MNWVARAKLEYNKMAGLPEPILLAPYAVNVDFTRAKAIADEYEVMGHTPTQKYVAKSYSQMIAQVLDQLELLCDKGLGFTRWYGQGEPYPDSSAMRFDVHYNKHLWYFPTDSGFGATGDLDLTNPLCATAAFGDNHGYLVLANDAFRIVHDVFGHSVCDNGFGANGEEVAWRSHREMFTYGAIGALTSETRGQNSWVNFGKHLRDETGYVGVKGDAHYVHPSKRPFAQQKTGLMPEWTWQHD